MWMVIKLLVHELFQKGVVLQGGSSSGGCYLHDFLLERAHSWWPEHRKLLSELLFKEPFNMFMLSPLAGR